MVSATSSQEGGSRLVVIPHLPTLGYLLDPTNTSGIELPSELLGDQVIFPWLRLLHRILKVDLVSISLTRGNSLLIPNFQIIFTDTSISHVSRNSHIQWPDHR